MQTLYRAFCALLFLGAVDNAAAFDTKAPFAVLMDASSGTFLYEKNADESMAPASMGKLMTAEVVFHALEDGRLNLDETFVVSENAWRKGGASSGGSTMFAQLDSRIPLRDLIKSILIQSGNDACIVVAEGLAGSEIAFADMMNDRAKAIGMKNSTFQNSTGLPDPDQQVTARDLAILARHLIKAYPEFYPIFSEPDFTWNGITQRNRNPLLTAGVNADGLKTGYTRESGYGLVGSAVSGSQRLIVVVNGLRSSRARAEESRKLLEWGFRNFREVVAFKADEVVGQAKVFGGAKSRVGLRGDGPVTVLVSRADREPLKARVVYDGPIKAPVREGTRIGAFKVWQGERLIQETPLYASENVAEGKLHQRALSALGELAFGWL